MSFQIGHSDLDEKLVAGDFVVLAGAESDIHNNLPYTFDYTHVGFH